MRRRTSWIGIDTIGRSMVFQADKRALVQARCEPLQWLTALSGPPTPDDCVTPANRLATQKIERTASHEHAGT